ncbi:hypothetical protein [Erwinia sp. PsM31]|uniref:hypothetical protein n=1 Tax=Erwinia sp. PsM31 TaxID=3030535 RepID=UPI00263B93D1|nr:hypothetical protein [Erwinia sp. PsM31]MDN4629713.1 hypothetical protein [Erwinia sp. PsM31]
MLNCYDIEVENYQIENEELIYETDGIELKLKEIITTQAIDGKEVAIIDHKEFLENWFPDTGCHIFISHSHKDEKKAIYIANRLYEKYGIKSFIDSKFWGFVDKAISDINHLHSKCDDNSNYLDYKRSMRVASNFYIVLINALTDGIFKSDSCWFLNTQNSLNASNNDSDGTYSPWLYTEMNFTSTVIRTPHPHRPKVTQESFDHGLEDMIKSSSRDFAFKFSPNKSHMQKVQNDKLLKVISNTENINENLDIDKSKPFQNLDAIYNFFSSSLHTING